MGKRSKDNPSETKTDRIGNSEINENKTDVPSSYVVDFYSIFRKTVGNFEQIFV